jgi:peptidoglycan hydrolase CwlO-like protein
MKRTAVMAAFAMLLLSSCSENKNTPEQLNTRIEEADSKAQEAMEKVEELETKVSDLEDKVEELEANQP